MQKVLLVEDDPLISKSLQMSLAYQGFEVVIGETAAQALAQINNGKFEIFILDVNLPDGNGFEICKHIRSFNDSVPILMLTAQTEEEFAIKGISLGADDYIRKPFGVKELVARMQRLLSRSINSPRILTYGSLKIDQNKRLAWANANELSLGKREFEILFLLIQKKGDVTTREEILSALGEESGTYDRTIDSHLSHLRKKIRDSGETRIHITPVYGVGYRLEEK